MAIDNSYICLLIQKVFEIDKDQLRSEAIIEDVLNWDSYMIMNLLVEIENEYHVKIDLNALFEIRTVGELISLIKESIS